MVKLIKPPRLSVKESLDFMVPFPLRCAVKATLDFKLGYLNAWELEWGQYWVERKSADNLMEIKGFEECVDGGNGLHGACLAYIVC